MLIHHKQLSIIALVTVLFLGTPEITLAAASFLESTLWGFVNGFFGRLFGLGGLMLDFTTQKFVIEFAKDWHVPGQVGLGDIVNAAWVNIRDIFNLTFIFGLVYIGFKMILGTDDSQSKRWLAHLIMAALLVNFSLFITKFIIDFTNVLATQIATSAFSPNAAGDIQISSVFVDSFGITTFFGGGLGLLAEGSNKLGFIFGAAIIYIVGMFVFTAGAFLLTIRYASLILYMIFSPLMFIGWVFPQLQSTTDKYWKGFLGKAFFAPIYLLLIYLSARMVNFFYANGGGKNPDFAGVFSGGGSTVEASFANTIPPFILSAVFLIASVLIAGKLGADGAGAVMKAGNKFRGVVQRGAGRVTAGSAGWAARNTAGRYANNLANSDSFRDRAGKSIGGRLALQTARGVASSSFDARNAGGIGKTLGVGEGKKGGFGKTVEDKIKADEKFAKSLGKVDITDKAREKIDSEALKDSSVVAEELKNETSLEMKSIAEDALKDKESEFNNTKSASSEKLERLKATQKSQGFMNSGGDQKLNDAIKSEEEELSTIDKKFESELENLRKTIAESNKNVEKTSTSLKKAIDVATAKEEAKVTYGRQIDFAKQLKKTESFQNHFYAGQTSSASHANIIKKYGTDGTKMVKQEKRKKDANLLAEIQKESADPKEEKVTSTD